MKKQKEIDLIKLLRQKVKTENIILEGATIAFKLHDGQTGTWTLCDNLGVRLRLIQESKIQEKMMELSINDMAIKSFKSSIPKSPPIKTGESYLG